MNQYLANITIVVDNYDKAIQFYRDKLLFDLIEDTRISDSKRWVRIAPKGSRECCLLLAKAAAPEQETRIGNQTGGRVFLFLHTDDFWRDYNRMVSSEIKFIRAPHEEPYGTVAVFEDLYGNLWDLIQPKPGNTSL
ncbi:MAG TPA: VOC family protein [Ohtaekwangia sp.]